MQKHKRNAKTQKKCKNTKEMQKHKRNAKKENLRPHCKNTKEMQKHKRNAKKTKINAKKENIRPQMFRFLFLQKKVEISDPDNNTNN
jgi:hypothetical protein